MQRRRERTLADELADLATAAPEQEYDFDADLDLGRAADVGATGGTGLDASDGEDGDFGAAATAAEANGGAREGRSRRPSLRAAPELGKEYAGKRVSVAEAFGGGEGDDGSRAPFREEVEDDEEEEESGEDEEEPKKQRSLPAPATTDEKAELAALDAEYAAADAAALGSQEALREATARDAKKGAAVSAQRQAWDRALEARIMLQRALGGCNRLPRPETMALVAGAEGADEGEEEPEAEEGKKSATSASAISELRVAAAGVAREAAALAIRLAEAADVLAARAAGREAGRGKKRKQEGGGGESDEEESEEEEEEEGSDGDGSDLTINPETVALWRRLERSVRSFEPVRDAAFDRWHRKAALLAGGGAALRGGLRVLDQPPSRQVAAAMAGSFGNATSFSSPSGGGNGNGAENRLLSRSRLMRADAPKRLGEPSVPAGAKKNRSDSSSSDSGSSDSSSDDEEEEEEEEDKQQTFSPSGDARDRDTYDDGEFYSQLLKEFVEANASTAAAGAGGAGIPSSGRGNIKRRKVVDRRASKGRKLRFDVMEKLVGFMAPTVDQGGGEEEPALARQLAGCLFGVVRSSKSKKGSKKRAS